MLIHKGEDQRTDCSLLLALLFGQKGTAMNVVKLPHFIIFVANGRPLDFKFSKRNSPFYAREGKKKKFTSSVLFSS